MPSYQLYKTFLKQFVLTKMDLREKDSEEKWILFDCFCLPAMMNQTCMNYEWIIFLIGNVDKGRLKKYNGTNITFINVKDDKDINKVARNVVRDKTNIDTEWIISTKVKPNFSPHSMFIETIRDSFNFQQCFINLEQGYVYDIEKDRMFLVKFKKNMFKSFVEKTDNLKTIYYLDYGLLPCHDWINIDTKPLWLEIVRNEDVPEINRMKRVFPSDLNGFKYKELSKIS